MVADARQAVQPLDVAIKCTADTEVLLATALFVPLGLTLHVRVTDLEVDVDNIPAEDDDILPERLDES